jgi:hypothetical protein
MTVVLRVAPGFSHGDGVQREIHVEGHRYRGLGTGRHRFQVHDRPVAGAMVYD